MGRDVFLQAYIGGGSQEIATRDVLACFSDYVTHMNKTFVDVRFTGADSCTIFVDTTSPSIDTLMVSRPCRDARLAHCLFRVMRLGNFVLFEPGSDRFIALRDEVIEHLPEGMAEGLGELRATPDIESFIEAFGNP